MQTLYCVILIKGLSRYQTLCTNEVWYTCITNPGQGLLLVTKVNDGGINVVFCVCGCLLPSSTSWQWLCFNRRVYICLCVFVVVNRITLKKIKLNCRKFGGMITLGLRKINYVLWMTMAKVKVKKKVLNTFLL